MSTGTNRSRDLATTVVLGILLATFAGVLATACHKTEEPEETPFSPAPEAPTEHRVEAHALVEGAPPAVAEDEEQVNEEAASGEAAFHQAIRDQLERRNREKGAGSEPESEPAPED